MNSATQLKSGLDLWSMTKYFLMVFVPLATLIIGMVAVMRSYEVRTEIAVSASRESNSLDILESLIVNDYTEVISDLMYLSEVNALKAVLRSNNVNNRKILAEDFLQFSKRKRMYDQIRLLNETGMEIVRVNFNMGNPNIVPDGQLQAKGTRYYFADTFTLGREGVFVSLFDLNMERGQIEWPLKPMIRFGAPVFDDQGEKRGIVLLNYLGSRLLGNLESVSIGVNQFMLLNSHGYWLKGIEARDEWGFMYADRKDRRFGSKFRDAWQQISNTESGHFHNSDGSFAYRTVRPLLMAQGERVGSATPVTDQVYWKLISHVPSNILSFRTRASNRKYLLMGGVLMAVVIICSVLAARMFMHREMARKQKMFMEEELLKVQKLESIGILAGGIAHDLNNLLIGIVGNISLARMYENPAEKDRRLAEAEKASVQIKGLTQQLLTFSKGGAPIKKIASVAKLLRDSATLASSGSNIRCEFFIPDDLWPAEMDEGQMNQVISNIIINADQAMPGGGTVEVSAKNVLVNTEYGLPLKDGEYVEVSIEDHGTGISEADLPKIFDPFFTTKQTGSGLGLATAYSIIQKHDGHITVESEVGVGTTLCFYLPASADVVLVTETAEEDKPIMGEGRILVMDNEELVRKLASDMLNTLGYKVTTVAGGVEAIEKYKAAMESGNPFDAIMVDLTIPGGMGGKETIQRLLEIDRNVKAIASSGYSNDPVLTNFEEYGFKGVVAKPYKITELSEVLHRILTEGAA